MSILYSLKLILNIIYFLVQTVYRMFVFVCCFASFDSRVAWALQSLLQAKMAVQHASIFAKKYGTLVRYTFFVMVWVRYAGTLFEFAY